MDAAAKPISPARARRMASQAIDRAARLRAHAHRDLMDAEKAEHDAEVWEQYAADQEAPANA
jgi:hypothetical protein